MRRPHAPRPRPVPSIPALTLTGALALTGATLAAPAAAKPRTSTIEELLQPETAVLIAHVETMPPVQLDRPFSLRVERAVRGNQKPGELVSFLSPGCQTCKVGDRIVAFVDTRKSDWSATGILLAGPAIEDGVLRMESGSATSAHAVTPALVPFPRLEALLTHDVPLYPHVRGPFVVPGPAGLTAMADPIRVRVRAPGLPDNTQSLGRPPGGYPLDRLDYDPANGVIVTGLWHSGARNVPIAGEVLGVQEGGDDIDAAFVLLRPAHLDEASLRRYLQDPDCPEPRYAFEIRTAAAALPLSLPSSPFRAAPGTLDGRPVTAFSLAPARIESAAARLTFPPGTFGRKRESLSDSALLVARLLQGALPCELARGPRAPRTACTLRYLGVQFPPATPGAPVAPPVPPWPDPK